MKKKGVLGILLAVLMSVGMLLQFALPAIAEENDPAELMNNQAVPTAPAMVMGTSVLETGAGLDDSQEVWYFGKPWNVISYEGRDGNGNLLRYQNRKGAWENLYSSKAVTLLCNGFESYPNTYWGKNSAYPNEYSSSRLLSYFNEDFNRNWLGTDSLDEQKGAILPRTLKGGGDLLGTEMFDANRVKGNTVFYQLFWPLSEAEARKLPQSLLAASYHWWLRTPGPFENNRYYDRNGLVAFVFLHEDRDHEIDYGNVYAPDGPGLLRPAFDLNGEAVLFTTSVGVEGKASGEEGPDAMQPVGTTTGNSWKLTLKDDGTYPGLEGHSSFRVTAQTITQTGVTVEYTGAVTGKNEYISAIVKDTATGELLSYGRICKAESADGSVTINLPENSPCREQLYVFNEMVRPADDYKRPDLASKLFPIERKNAVHNWDRGKVTKAPTDTAEGVKTYTCQDCGATKNESIPKLVISGTLSAKAKTKGKTALTFSWSRIKGAEGYDVFFSPCNKNDKKEPYKLAKTIGKNDPLTWTKTGLKKCSSYKFAVKAFITVNGKKKYVRTSPHLHTLTTGYSKEYTNAKSVTVNKKKVTLKKGKTFRIKADVTKVDKKKKLLPKSHTPKLRYLSTNEKVAKVTSSGKIKAKGKGSCKIIVFAHNGVSKTVTVKVK